MPNSEDNEVNTARRSVLVGIGGAISTGMVAGVGRAKTGSYEPLSTEEIPDGTECPVCGMMVKNFPVGNAQLVSSGGKREFFCSPGCLTAFYTLPDSDGFVDPADFGSEDRDVVQAVWTRDYVTDGIIDATTAYFVIDNNSENVKSGIPMGENPIPFEEYGEAQEYAEEHDLSNSEIDVQGDIVQGIGSFDTELARAFRPRFLPELSPNSPFADSNGEAVDKDDAADVLFEWNTNNGEVDGEPYTKSEMADFLFEWNQARS
jgi:nitrous oxide reductase accessory protein NosL